MAEQPPDDTVLRDEQIKLCAAEVDVTVDLLSRAEPVTRGAVDSPDIDWERWKYLDASRPVMAGFLVDIRVAEEVAGWDDVAININSMS